MKDLESIDPEFYNSLVWIKYVFFKTADNFYTALAFLTVFTVTVDRTKRFLIHFLRSIWCYQYFFRCYCSLFGLLNDLHVQMKDTNTFLTSYLLQNSFILFNIECIVILYYFFAYSEPLFSMYLYSTPTFRPKYLPWLASLFLPLLVINLFFVRQN